MDAVGDVLDGCGRVCVDPAEPAPHLPGDLAMATAHPVGSGAGAQRQGGHGEARLVVGVDVAQREDAVAAQP